MDNTKFGLDLPSGDLTRDLNSGKRVRVRRGQETSVSEVEAEERTLRFVCSTDGIKRDGNRLRNNGWDLGSFAKNPVMLWAHDYEQPPVGSWSDWGIEEGDGEQSALVMTARFADHEFADTVYRLYLNGHMNAVSIGWTPLEFENIEDSEGRVTGFDFIKNELLECSAVPIPADPDALVQAVARGIITPDGLERFARATRIGTLSRGEAYVLDSRGGLDSEEEPEPIPEPAPEEEPTEEPMEYGVNEIAVQAGIALIQAGAVSDEEWSFSEDDAAAIAEAGREEEFYLLADPNSARPTEWAAPFGRLVDDAPIVFVGALEEALQIAEGLDSPLELTEAVESLLMMLPKVDEEPEAEEPEGGDPEGGEPEAEGLSVLAMRDDMVESHNEIADLLTEVASRLESESVDSETQGLIASLEAKLIFLLDIVSEMSETAGGGVPQGGGMRGGWSDLAGVLKSLGATPKDYDPTRTDTGFDGWSPEAAATGDGEGSADLVALANWLMSEVDADEAPALSQERIGKKVSRRRVEGIAKAARCIHEAGGLLDRLLEEIGESELLTEDEAEEVVDAPADEQDPETTASAKAGNARGDDPEDTDEALANGLVDMADRLASEAQAGDERRVAKAIGDLAASLDVPIRKCYIDDII